MTTQTIGAGRVSEYSAALPGTRQHVRPDCDIQVEAERAIRQDSVLHGTADQVDVLVNGGIAYLSGYVASATHKARAESDVCRVKGVKQVENHLFSDDELRMLVAQELACNADLSHYLFEVRSTRGFIRLDGQVNSADLANAAENLAASVGGVRAVVNCLRCPDRTNVPANERVLVPGVGQEVYASDGRLGRVERVIVDAGDRQLAAVAVDARFGPWPDDRERHILVPIAGIRNVNASGVELNITSDEAAHCLEFDPKAFITPDPDAQLPYGYLCSEVLLEPVG